MEDVVVRVRGIYSTAITKLLLDAGVEVGDASEKIKKRFNLEDSDKPPTVTVKDSRDGLGVVIIGKPSHVDLVSKIIRENIEDYVVWTSKLPLHSIVKGEVLREEADGVVVGLPNGLEGFLREPSLRVGEEVLVDVVKPPFKSLSRAELSLQLTVIGDYTSLIRDGRRRIILSEHIKNPIKKRELLALGNLLNSEGWSIKWRSAAKDAPLEVLMEDFKKTMKLALEVLKKAENSPPRTIVLEGHLIQELGFTRDSKMRLDKVRDLVVKTVKGHHILKSTSREYSSIVDFVEYLLEDKPELKEFIEGEVEKYNYKLVTEISKVTIQHIPVDSGKPIYLTPGYIVENSNGKLVVKRSIKSRGYYDGLRVKREIGDYDLMEVYKDNMLTVHNYYSKSGEWKGSYINLNTAPEILPGTIRYYDLLVDIVVSRDGRVEVLDFEEYEKVRREGIISPKLAEKVEEALKKAEELGRQIVEKHLNSKR